MIEQTIFQSLESFCDGRVYPLIADEKAEAPYIIFTPISDVKGDVFCGLAESNNTIQVDIYHRVYFEALKLKEQVLSELEKLPIFNVNCTQSYESDTKLHRVMIEFSIIK